MERALLLEVLGCLACLNLRVVLTVLAYMWTWRHREARNTALVNCMIEQTIVEVLLELVARKLQASAYSAGHAGIPSLLAARLLQRRHNAQQTAPRPLHDQQSQHVAYALRQKLRLPLDMRHAARFGVHWDSPPSTSAQRQRSYA